MQISSGARLALLLLDSFSGMVDEVVQELDRRGHPGVTANHEFALTAVDEGADSASALGRRLGVSKQAAAKTIAALEQLGYVERAVDPADARRKRLVVTARGYDMVAVGGATFDALRARWAAAVGEHRVLEVEAALVALVGGEPRSVPVVPAPTPG